MERNKWAPVTHGAGHQRTPIVFIGDDKWDGWMHDALRLSAPQSTPKQLYRCLNEHRESFSPKILEVSNRAMKRLLLDGKASDMNKESAKDVLNEVYLTVAGRTKKRKLEEAAAAYAQTEAFNQRLGSERIAFRFNIAKRSVPTERFVDTTGRVLWS